MPISHLDGFSRLAIHTMTNKPWSLEQCIAAYTHAGVPGISVWRNVLQPMGAPAAGRMLRDAGLSVVSLVRGGFFPAFEASKRQEALDDNRRALDEAAAIGAPLVVLVCGAVPGMTLPEARKQIRDAIATLLPYAQANKVKLAIEPMHPMYAADRSAINTMAQAREICQALQSPWLGIAVDVYHTWWDPDLEKEIQLAGQQKTLLAFHICDWRVQTRDLLNDRGLMGEGCIPLKQIRNWVESTGFTGFHEVEIFSTQRWATDQTQYLAQIKAAYLQHA
ncbi:MAG TPA: sugar phosphate isomerase/epimerase family protein [Tepidisphaeraceae bacterium]|nr:sugar phosphate isomerase/epimerase family protein [Tepidisphaeraceae bacterium]